MIWDLCIRTYTPQTTDLRPYSAHYHEFLPKLYRYCRDNIKYSPYPDQEEEEEWFFFECVRLWQEQDPDFENAYGLWELAQDGVERVKTSKVVPQMYNVTVQSYVPMEIPADLANQLDIRCGKDKV